MKKTAGGFDLSATDLVGYLNCKHLSRLDRAVAEGALAQPKAWDPQVHSASRLALWTNCWLNRPFLLEGRLWDSPPQREYR